MYQLIRRWIYWALVMGLFAPEIISSQPAIVEVNSWAYQLQNIDPAAVAADSTFQLVVLDYSRDGSAEEAFTSAEIGSITASGKLPIAYLSIGEAENYRWYWNPAWDADEDGIPDPGAPAWLGPMNPDWGGNYKVRFWDPQWQAIIFQYLDTIVAQGFRGAYLDIVDAYYYWMEENSEQPAADSLMVQFILRLREHVPDSTFYLIPQNGETIIYEPHVSPLLRDSLFRAIQAIGVEDVFFPGEAEENNPFAPDSYRLDILAEFQRRGEKILSVEYLTEPDLIETYRSAAAERQFVPYATVRALDTLTSGLGLPLSFHVFHVTRRNSTIGLFPNPTNGSLSLVLPADKVFLSFELLDLKGRILLSGDFTTASSFSLRPTLELPHLPSGIYLLLLKESSGYLVRRFTVIK